MLSNESGGQIHDYNFFKGSPPPPMLRACCVDFNMYDDKYTPM